MTSGDIMKDNNGDMYLVGNVNRNGGLCGCCNGVDEDDEKVGTIFDNPELINKLR